MIKERPILFNDEMVRAILEGRKTQTRRIAKNIEQAPTFRSGWKACRKYSAVSIDTPSHMLGRYCPIGKPGDRLWVRENFLQLMHGQVTAGDVKYCASIDPRSTGTPKNAGYWWRKRPSIHMPRWASRITLEITDVRVERLQNISGDDIAAEGVTDPIGSPRAYGVVTKQLARDQFIRLWESINGPDSWQVNPWVWVVEFKRIDGGDQ
ncbi:MAG: hypothetical protein VX939_00610 [Pseudomonadota bacterium]|nr:hypothetical protein [Pseudomonadota bacterium]